MKRVLSDDGGRRWKRVARWDVAVGEGGGGGGYLQIPVSDATWPVKRTKIFVKRIKYQTYFLYVVLEL